MSNTTASSKSGARVRIAGPVAAIAAAAGLVVYLVTSTTGFLAGRAVDPLPIVFTAIAIVLLVADVLLRRRLGEVVRDVLLVVSVALLCAGFAFFLLARVPLAADVYFIPVNYPAAEETALMISFAGLALYLIAIVVLVVEAFAGKRAAARVAIAATA